MVKNLNDLKSLISSSSISDVVNNYILECAPICFGGDKSIIYLLKKELADKFEIHPKDIEIVGSAKLGISLNSKIERYGKPFNESSDIDLAIISNELFDIAWNELSKKENKFLLESDKKKIETCYYYIPQGIISPNQLPMGLNFTKKFWAILSSLSLERYENRKIRGRIFKNWWFAEKYYSIQLSKLSK